MIVYQINVECNFGSTGKIAEALGKMVIDQGGQAYLAHGRKHKPSALSTYKVGNTFSYAVHLLLTRLFDRHGLGSYFSTKRLVKHIEEVKPTVVHLHNIHGYYLNYPVLFKFLERSNIPVVWTLHDCWGFTGHCSHFENIGCTKWKTQCEKCPQKNTYPTSLLRDRSKKNFRDKKNYFLRPSNVTIVTVSHWLGALANQSILGKHRIKTIHNGVDVSVFKPLGDDMALREKYKLGRKKVFLGVASVWSKNKGLDDFIKLSKQLREDETIVLIGLNDKQIQTLPKNMVGIRRTANVEELVRWYSMASVYVNTSVEETFGMTSAEALACGTPILVYNATACPEMVADGVGHVVPKNNIDHLRSSIDQIIGDTTTDYQKICRERVLKNFDIHEKRQEYYQLYKEVQKQKN